MTSPLVPQVGLSPSLSVGAQQAHYIAFMLRELRGALDAAAQSLLFDTLKWCASLLPVGTTIQLPVFLGLTACEGASPVARTRVSAARDSAFIHRHRSTEWLPAGAPDVVWSVKETASIVVQLCNPFAVPVFLEALSVQSSGARCHFDPISVSVPPHTASHAVTLYGAALESGTLSLQGCTAQLCSVSCSFESPPVGLEVIPGFPCLAVQGKSEQHTAMMVGERYSTVFGITNHGTGAVATAGLRLTELGSDTPLGRELLGDISLEWEEGALPLHGNQSMQIQASTTPSHAVLPMHPRTAACPQGSPSER